MALLGVRATVRVCVRVWEEQRGKGNWGQLTRTKRDDRERVALYRQNPGLYFCVFIHFQNTARFRHFQREIGVAIGGENQPPQSRAFQPY